MKVDTRLNRPLWQKAASLAARLHGSQRRKDGATPYIAHPFRVAMTVRDVFGCDDEVAICAALLHDVIEDTTADYDEIAEELGTAVADAVAAMTKDMRMREDLREAAYDEQLCAGPWQARMVKLADVYDNLCDAPDAATVKKTLPKAERAIALAGADEHLRPAVEDLRALAEAMERKWNL